MYSFILIAIAAICKAICDNITHHWSTSVFNTYTFNERWWNPAISWKNKYDASGKRTFVPIVFTDAFHFFKGIMVTCIFCAIVVSTGYKPLVNHYADVLIYFVIWGIFFELFYGKLLKK